MDIGPLVFLWLCNRAQMPDFYVNSDLSQQLKKKGSGDSNATTGCCPFKKIEVKVGSTA